MPSKNQPAGQSTYANVYERAFSDEIDLPPGPLLRGINSEEAALRAHRACHEYDGREKHKRIIAEKLREYRD